MDRLIPNYVFIRLLEKFAAKPKVVRRYAIFGLPKVKYRTILTIKKNESFESDFETKKANKLLGYTTQKKDGDMNG